MKEKNRRTHSCQKAEESRALFRISPITAPSREKKSEGGASEIVLSNCPLLKSACVKSKRLSDLLATTRASLWPDIYRHASRAAIHRSSDRPFPLVINHKRVRVSPRPN